MKAKLEMKKPRSLLPSSCQNGQRQKKPDEKRSFSLPQKILFTYSFDTGAVMA